jgi:hypothetical protein
MRAMTMEKPDRSEGTQDLSAEGGFSPTRLAADGGRWNYKAVAAEAGR